MKRLLVTTSGLLVVMYLSAIPAVAQRAQSAGRGATAHGSERAHAASSSKGEADRAGAKTPGELLRQNTKLSDKLSAILKQQNPPVTDLQAASQGFKNLGQFVAAVHVSQNLGIPFSQLKAQEKTSGSLGKAIHALKPDVDAKAESKKAAKQADVDIKSSESEAGS